jgi:NADPH:quinone reductase-like Zn-dependent oxidoreductase
MKALKFDKVGALSELKLVETAKPERRQGSDALVRVVAAAINPSDAKNVLGRMSETSAPRIPGRDFAGWVVEGPEPWKGKAVFGTGGDLGFGRDGSHAEYLAVPSEALVEKPADLSFAEASAMALSYLAAWSSVVRAGGLQSSDTALVLGAAGAVGSSAVRIAKHLGARVIGVMRDASESKRAAELPADAWVNLQEGPLSARVRGLTGGRGANFILDVVGGPLFEETLRSLAPGGRCVVIASVEPEVKFDLIDFYHRQAHLIGVDTLKLSFQESAEVLREILPAVARGILTPPPVETVVLENAVDAYEAVLASKTRAKQIIYFPEAEKARPA